MEQGTVKSAAAPRAEVASGESLLERVFLHAGQLVASAERCEVTTIVGSCVMVCLIDPVRRVGGANHYVLPLAGPAQPTPRFGDVATRDLVLRMAAHGCREGELQAKIFGGASVLLASDRIGVESLGAKNVRAARQALLARGIPVVAEDVGGTRGRKIVFRTDTGDVWVRRI